MAALRVFLAASALALPLWVAATTPAQACSCGFTPLEEQVAAADLIVLGQISHELRLLGPLPPDPLTPPDLDRVVSAGPGETPVTVTEYLKGAGPQTIMLYRWSISVGYRPDGKVLIPYGISSCELYASESVLLLNSREDGRYEAGVCTGSFSYSASDAYATDRIEQIRQIVRDQAAPQPTALPPLGAGPPSRDGSSISPLLVATVAGAGLASTALLLGRRRES